MVTGGVPILEEDSNVLSSLTLYWPNGDMSRKIEFFESLKNADNLTYLKLRELDRIKFSSLSDYLKDELPSVTTLNLDGESATSPVSILEDLQGIEKFTGLKNLIVNYTTKILDISAIKNCPTLTDATLTYCSIQNLSGMEELTNLQNLTLNNNSITSLKPLENLKNLTSLNLENNAISDTSSYIDTDGTTKTYRNLDILAGLHSSRGGKLTTLKLAGNDNIIDFSPVSSLSWSNKSGF